MTGTRRPLQLFGAILALHAATVTAGTAATRHAADLTLTAAAGGGVRPLELGENQKAAVVVFVAIGCPICNGSAPTLAALGKTYADRGVAFYVVYTDADLTPDAVRKHQAEYALPGTAVLDPGQALAARLGAKITPTVYVIGPGGAVRYEGAIDDAYAAVGRKRFAATKHYLADALDAVLADKKIDVSRTTPVGCEL